MKTSVIIVSLNGRERIAMPVRALLAGNPPPDEIIVVDNGSTDGLGAEVTRRWPEEVRLVSSPRNLGFAGGNNLGLVNATGDILILLNDDTEPAPGWLAPLMEQFKERPRLGIAGCQLVYPGTGKVQHLGGIVHRNGLTDHAGWGEEGTEGAAGFVAADYASGAALAIRRQVIADIGLLDDGFWPIYFEEVDFCERARRAGWEVGVVPRSRVIHHESQTTGRLSARFLRLYHRNRLRYLLKNRRAGEWPGTLKAEMRWLLENRPWDNLWPCALAWAWLPLQATDLLRRRRGGS